MRKEECRLTRSRNSSGSAVPSSSVFNPHLPSDSGDEGNVACPPFESGDKPSRKGEEEAIRRERAPFVGVSGNPLRLDDDRTNTPTPPSFSSFSPPPSTATESCSPHSSPLFLFLVPSPPSPPTPAFETRPNTRMPPCAEPGAATFLLFAAGGAIATALCFSFFCVQKAGRGKWGVC